MLRQPGLVLYGMTRAIKTHLAADPKALESHSALLALPFWQHGGECCVAAAQCLEHSGQGQDGVRSRA